MWIVVTTTLILWLPLINFITYHQYPAFRVEWLVLFGLLILPGVVLSLWSEMALPRSAGVVLATIIGFSATLQMDLGIYQLIAVFVVCAVSIWQLKSHFGPVLTATLATMTVVAAISGPIDTTGVDEAGFDDSLPPIIHIILDGHIGLQGIPEHSPPNFINDKLESLFLDSGFTLYPAAYSRYTSTVDSLNGMMNFSSAKTNLFFEARDKGQAAGITSNRYFELLGEQGYRFRITQTPEIEFCQAVAPDQLSSCVIQSIPAMMTVAEGGESIGQRVSMIALTLIRQSRLMRNMLASLRLESQPGVAHFHPRSFQAFVTDILAHPTGHAFVGHFVFPHSPYAIDGECRADYGTDIWQRFAHFTVAGFPRNTPASRGARYHRYLSQVLCGHQLISALFKDLRQAGIFERSIIVIHGDHGSRISLNVPTPAPSPTTGQDLIDNYSALFAVKLPGLDANRVDSPTPIDIALTQATARILGKPIESDGPSHHLFLDGPDDHILLNAHPFPVTREDDTGSASPVDASVVDIE